jgi:hypothetical protein
LFVQVVSWIITIWVFGSLLVFVLARVLGGEVSMWRGRKGLKGSGGIEGEWREGLKGEGD